MHRKINVQAISGTQYRVTVEEGKTKTQHEVTVSPSDLQRYGHGATAQRLLEASFEFLLQRESKESILSRFVVSDIERYFPDYGKEIRGLL
jgi:hypothetical protein